MMAGRRLSERSSTPITGCYVSIGSGGCIAVRLTVVDGFQLADNVQPDFGEVVLQEMQEERE
jgi:hypothetical protein